MLSTTKSGLGGYTLPCLPLYPCYCVHCSVTYSPYSTTNQDIRGWKRKAYTSVKHAVESLAAMPWTLLKKKTFEIDHKTLF